jgi:ring-1,2-phenylacetyl-CoA epoxidase subunit PaaD
VSALYDAVAAVPDPELPVLTIGELGILRSVDVDGDRVVVGLTPTYSGCPAFEAIADDVAAVVRRHGYADIDVRRVLAPAWSTDCITTAGRVKLEAAGVAPPGPVLLQIAVRCPRCGSGATREVSRFGPTACTALWVCGECREPFEHVKAV